MGFFLNFIGGKGLLIILVVLVLGFGYYKWHALETQAAEVAQQLDAEKKNAEVLRTNVAIAKAVNEDNQKVLDQLQLEKAAAAKAAADLKGNIAAANKRLDEVKRRLAAVEIPPAPLSPYLIIAVESIQELRAKLPEQAASAPQPAASAPKAPASSPSFLKRIHL